MYIEYRSYFLFNRFLPKSCILTRENVRFFQSFLRGFLECLCWKAGFSYLLSYLIDKKEYRKGKIIGRKDCWFKKQLYFCAVKMAKENVRFFAIFLLIPIYFLLAMTYIENNGKSHIKIELFSTARQTFLHLHQNKDNQSPI